MHTAPSLQICTSYNLTNLHECFNTQRKSLQNHQGSMTFTVHKGTTAAKHRPVSPKAPVAAVARNPGGHRPAHRPVQRSDASEALELRIKAHDAAAAADHDDDDDGDDSSLAFREERPGKARAWLASATRKFSAWSPKGLMTIDAIVRAILSRTSSSSFTAF